MSTGIFALKAVSSMMTGKVVNIFVAVAISTFAALANRTQNHIIEKLYSPLKHRIIGGFDAPYRVPFLVSLTYKLNKGHICGGAILNENWILTAAHCIKWLGPPTKKEDILLTVGYKNSADPVEEYDVQEIKLHGDYNDRTMENDIALLKAATPFKIDGNKVKPIEIDRKTNYTNEEVYICGLGGIDFNRTAPEYLQCLNQAIVSNSICKRKNTGLKVHSTNICAQGPENTTVFYGDSGSPLVLKEKVIGICSQLDNFPLGKPNVYTRVSSYYTWIKNIIERV